MADTDASDTKTAKSKGSRVQWTEGETRALIQVWEDNIGDLRRQKRNAGVYDTMVLHLGRLDITRSRKQVVTKIENLMQMYRKLLKGSTTGSEGISWPYFYEIHRFLGALPVNDASLVEECMDSFDAEEVNDTIEVICEDAGAMDSEDSPSLGQLDLPSTSAGSSSVGGMKAKGKRSPSNTGPEQPIKKKKLAEKQLEFMTGLLDEQRALRLCWESSRSAELSLRERQLSLLQQMHDDFILMQQKPKEK